MEIDSEIIRHLRERNIFERIYIFFPHIFIESWFTEQRKQLP